MFRVREVGVAALLAVAFTAGAGVWILWPDGGAQGQQVFDPVAVQPVLQQLGPNTTFHMVETIYRRYGAEAADVPGSEGPETQRSEAWITFDERGALLECRAETRSVDGAVVSTATLEGDDLVLRTADGTERHRAPGFRQNTTVDTMKTTIATATERSYERASNEPFTAGQVGGQVSLVFEVRRPIARSGAPAEAEGFQLPYVADLSAVEEVRRQYILPGEYRSVRSEIAVVGRDGAETVVESREYLVFEVVAAEVSQ